jgi:hypothetical protein
VNDGILIEVVHGGHDAINAILEFLFGGDADVTQNGVGEFGKEALDKVEPGAVFRREGELEAVRGVIGEPGFGPPFEICAV